MTRNYQDKHNCENTYLLHFFFFPLILAMFSETLTTFLYSFWKTWAFLAVTVASSAWGPSLYLLVQPFPKFLSCLRILSYLRLYILLRCYLFDNVIQGTNQKDIWIPDWNLELEAVCLDIPLHMREDLLHIYCNAPALRSYLWSLGRLWVLAQKAFFDPSIYTLLTWCDCVPSQTPQNLACKVTKKINLLTSEHTQY